MRTVGELTLGYHYPQTNRFIPIHRQKNMIMFEAADVMARLVKGDPSYRISHMYFEYENNSNGDGSVSSTPTLNRGMGRSSFDAITGSGPNPQDWLRVPIVTDGLLQVYPDNSDDYKGNAVTFTATSAASVSQEGESPAHNYFGTGVDGPSKIFAVALVAAPSPADHTKDLIFSRLVLTTPFPVSAGSHPAAFWSLRFL